MKIGIIGFGFMGGVHLSAIQGIEGASLAAVSSRTRPAADAGPRGNLPHVKSAVMPENTKWYDNWQELVDDENVDAVDICLPTQLHKQVTLAALARGKHVLCEKPMALNYADCAEMMEAASRSGRIFMVGQILRFMSPYQYAASFIDSIGRDKLKSVTMVRRTGYPQWSAWLSNDACSGGAILDLLSHDIDQVLRLFGLPSSVTAVSDGPVDTMLGKLRYDDGLEVGIEGGWYDPEMPFSAGFVISSDTAQLALKNGILQMDRDGSLETIALPETLEYSEQMAYFIHCCRTNEQPELCLPVESAEAVRVANLMRRSREQNGKELTCGK